MSRAAFGDPNVLLLAVQVGDLKEYLKNYFQSIRARWKAAGTPVEEIKAMMASANAVAVFFLRKLSECEVFVNTDFNMEGAICLREWTDKGNKYFYIM